MPCMLLVAALTGKQSLHIKGKLVHANFLFFSYRLRKMVLDGYRKTAELYE